MLNVTHTDQEEEENSKHELTQQAFELVRYVPKLPQSKSFLSLSLSLSLSICCGTSAESV